MKNLTITRDTKPDYRLMLRQSLREYAESFVTKFDELSHYSDNKGLD